MTLLNILLLFTFSTIFSLIFFELLYFYSKHSYLKTFRQKRTFPQENFLKRLVKRLNWPPGIILPKIFNYSHVETLLHKSGRPFNLTINNFITLHRLLGDIALFFIILIILLSGNIIHSLLICLFLWLTIVYLPILWLRTLISRRVRAFNYDFNTFIDMLSLTVNAGMNFENALFFTIAKFKGVIHEEFKNVQEEISYGLSTEKALENLSKKIDSLDLRRFTTALKQSKQLGTPLAQTLAIQSNLILTGRIQRAEELSRTASVKISLPLVFFIFPALLILYLAPALLQFMK